MRQLRGATCDRGAHETGRARGAVRLREAMASSNSGINELMEAEKQASEIVKEARAGSFYNCCLPSLSLTVLILTIPRMLPVPQLVFRR